jgi:hypothetical protein
LQVDQHYLRLLMARYFIRMNFTFRFGAFIMHPITGEIIIKMNTYFSKQIFSRFLLVKKGNTKY